MSEFIRNIQLRWSDLDPNFHVRHSIYYDWGAFVRVEFLNEYGLTWKVMHELKFGPILFREECVFRREIRSGDEIKMNLQLLRSKKDFSRWSIQHQIIKADGTVCAVLKVDGAWMDVITRKLSSPPEKVHEVFNQMPTAENFEWQ
ncbi:MAG TPA: thioesterase family protein [Flavisolibacter sp.]|jgi:acyl-CoA thioester hydrolase|nr:thioesterase family protein [Flavisolibacter sp.]